MSFTRPVFSSPVAPGWNRDPRAFLGAPHPAVTSDARPSGDRPRARTRNYAADDISRSSLRAFSRFVRPRVARSVGVAPQCLSPGTVTVTTTGSVAVGDGGRHGSRNQPGPPNLTGWFGCQSGTPASCHARMPGCPATVRSRPGPRRPRPGLGPADGDSPVGEPRSCCRRC